MLARLRHLPRYQIATLAVDGAWLGVCGWPAGIAAAGGRGDAGEASVVVCGEFLNAAELRRELRLPHAANAAEIALAAYRRWDDDLFAHLDGVYALALHDAASRWTLAGVDPNTVAVLQAVEIAGDVLVASEAKAFLCDPRFQPRLDELTCATLLALEAMIDGRSLFAGVEGLANGRHFEAHGGSIATVRHWDPREVAGGSLRGEPYLDHLAAAMGELSGPLFAGDDLLLPLTGGLDSRLLCAAAPAAADPLALTFGSALDPDVRRAAQMARARGLRHVVFGLEDDYLPRYGDGTVWLTEGRHNPATNFSGGQMDKVGECRFLVSGHFGELGRSTLRGDRLVPNWAMLEAGARDFERRYLSDMVRPSLPAEYWPALLGRRGPEMLQNAYDEVARKLAETRGLPVPDRLDIAMTEMRFHSCRAGLLYSSFWVDERAPFLSRRWMEAVFAGTPEERLDDCVRLRLIRRLDARLARVPWVRSRLPLHASEYVVWGLGVAARARRVRPLDAAASPVGEGSGRRRADSLLAWAKRRIYDAGEHRDEWLRGPGRAYAEDVLLSERLAERGFMDPTGVRSVWEAHLRGEDHTVALGQIMNIELWQRFFVDRDAIAGEAPLLTAGQARGRADA